MQADRLQVLHNISKDVIKSKRAKKHIFIFAPQAPSGSLRRCAFFRAFCQRASELPAAGADFWKDKDNIIHARVY